MDPIREKMYLYLIPYTIYPIPYTLLPYTLYPITYTLLPYYPITLLPYTLFSRYWDKKSPNVEILNFGSYHSRQWDTLNLVSNIYMYNKI